MFTAIMAIILMTVTQMVIGALWYSKLLFAKTFMELSTFDESKLKDVNVSSAYIKSVLLTVVKSVVIYAITYNIFFLLPQSFFNIVIFVALLAITSTFDDSIWGGKNIKLCILNAAQSFISILASFLIALLLINLM